MNIVKIVTEYITLGQFLKFINIIDSGSVAKSFLLDNVVLVNEEHETRRGRKIYPGDNISIGKDSFVVTK